MQAERENLFKTLSFVDYDVAGGLLRAYYDADDKLVFVLDFFESDTKPNVLLVINPIGNRKWDDILMNDYGVDLETIRPKKDNKYQKLDIEYSGLSEYDDLLQAYNSGDALDDALVRLEHFRNVAAVHAAIERRDDAELTVEKARDTIEKTQEKIAGLQEKVKKLRARLSAQRADIGKEPTKQSAAKILRTEAQIDSTTEKINRARKRVDNAQKRLVNAQDEIDAANAILEKLENVSENDFSGLPTKPMQTGLVMAAGVNLPEKKIEAADINQDFEEEAEIMAEDEVKPLFDEDPNVLDEDIAFKPVDFNGAEAIDNKVPSVQPDFMPVFDEKDDGLDLGADETQEDDFMPVDEEKTDFEEYSPVVTKPEFNVAPVVDAYEQDADEKIDSELLSGFAPLEIPHVEPEVALEEPLEEEKTVEYTVPQQNPVYEPIMPKPIIAEDVQENYSQDDLTGENSELSDVSPAPISSDFRPVSPMKSKLETDGVVAAAPVAVDETVTRKPSVIYYAMLVLLIVLSVFTLWLYQKSAGDSTPELGVKTQPVEDVVSDDVQTEKTSQDMQVVEMVSVEPVGVEIVDVLAEEKPVVDLQEPEVVFDESVEPEVVPVSEPEPVVLTPEVEPVVVETSEKPVEVEEIVEDKVETPFLSEQEVKLVQIKTEEEILREKPVYGVSSADAVFVEPVAEIVKPAEVVEAEPVSVPVVEPQEESVVEYEEPVVEYNEPVVEYEEPEIQQIVTSEEVVNDYTPDFESQPYDYGYDDGVDYDSYEDESPLLQQTASEMIAETEVVETCDDGNAPDVNGCCGGEESVLIDGEYMCCVIGGDECFPPLN